MCQDVRLLQRLLMRIASGGFHRSWTGMVYNTSGYVYSAVGKQSFCSPQGLRSEYWIEPEMSLQIMDNDLQNVPEIRVDELYFGQTSVAYKSSDAKWEIIQIIHLK